MKRPYVLSFERAVLAPSRSIYIVSEKSDVLFCGERIVIDESVQGGTSVVQLYVGAKNQRPWKCVEPPNLEELEELREMRGAEWNWKLESYVGTLSLFFGNGVAGNSVKLDPCLVGGVISFWLLNLRDEPVEWSAEIHGEADEG